MNKPIPPFGVTRPQEPSLPLGVTEEQLTPWYPPDESAILARVKHRVYQHYLSESSVSLRHRANVNWFRLVSLGLGVTACLLLLWMMPWNTKQNSGVGLSQPVLEFSGNIQHRTLSKPDALAAVGYIRANTSSTQQGNMGRPGFWNIQAQYQTQLTLSPPTSQQQVFLHHGKILVSVTPKTIKTFVVHVQPIQIWVKGTKFSVEQSESWLRIEVSEGQVVVRIPQRPDQRLSSSTGMRWDWQAKQATVYPLPPVALRNPHERWRWIWKQQGTKVALQYLLDLAQSQQYSPQHKEQWLMDAANQARRQQRYALEYRLYLWMYQHLLQQENREYKLFQAAQSCRKAYSVLYTPCSRLYQEYLQRFPSSNQAYRDACDYWYSRAQAIQATTPRLAQQAWSQYLARSKHSYYHNQVIRWIRSLRDKAYATLCRELEQRERAGLRSTSWLFPYCRPM